MYKYKGSMPSYYYRITTNRLSRLIQFDFPVCPSKLEVLGTQDERDYRQNKDCQIIEQLA